MIPFGIPEVSSMTNQPKTATPSNFRGNIYTKKHWLQGFSVLIFDIVLWSLGYFSVSGITGFYNFITFQAVLIPISVLIIILSLVGGYHYRTNFSSLRYASEHIIACLFAYPLAAFLLYVVASFGPHETSSRAIFSIAMVVFCFLSLISRRFVWFAKHTSDKSKTFLVIIDQVQGPAFYREYTQGANSHKLRYLAANPSLVGGHIDGEGSPILLEDALQFLAHGDKMNTGEYEAVILVAEVQSLAPDLLYRLGRMRFFRIPVYSIKSFYANYWKRLPLQIIGSTWPLDAEFQLLQHSVYSSLKRLLDLLFATILLVLALPVMILIAVAIVVTDGFPVFYCQERVGLRMNPFKLYKFRTMSIGSDKGDGYTRVGDSRVTRCGSLLRKTRLDELPQLWNVLKGDMSMIGPRAEWVRLVSDYENQIPFYHYRHLVLPGISGWAQINYPYGSSLEDAMQKLSYDLYYIENYSFRLDAEVLLKTIHTVLFGKGR